MVESSMCRNLLGDENGEVSIFLVDLGAKRDESQQVDAEAHTPHD